MVEFLQAIKENPEDCNYLKVYADWLEESGNILCAEFYRNIKFLKLFYVDKWKLQPFKDTQGLELSANITDLTSNLPELIHVKDTILIYSLHACADGSVLDKIWDSQIEVLGQSKLLEGVVNLNLSDTSLGNYGFQQIVNSPHVSALKVLDFSRNNLLNFSSDDEQFNRIKKFINQLDTLVVESTHIESHARRALDEIGFTVLNGLVQKKEKVVQR